MGRELGIEAEPLKAWDAGEHLAPDAARAEEPERRVALRPPVRDPERSNRASKWLRRPVLRNVRAAAFFEKAPERA